MISSVYTYIYLCVCVCIDCSARSISLHSHSQIQKPKQINKYCSSIRLTSAETGLLLSMYEYIVYRFLYINTYIHMYIIFISFSGFSFVFTLRFSLQSATRTNGEIEWFLSFKLKLYMHRLIRLVISSFYSVRLCA